MRREFHYVFSTTGGVAGCIGESAGLSGSTELQNNFY